MSDRILVIDDDHLMCSRLVRALRDRGFEAEGVETIEEARERVDAAPPDRAIVDLRMPGGSGLDLIREWHAAYPQMRILLLTGYGSMATAVDALRAGAENVLPKPADADEILAAFEGDEGSASSTSTAGDAGGAGGAGSTAGRTEEPTAPSLARAEWEHIQRVLADCDGNISEAARRLGLHRRSLQRKLAKRPPRD